MNSLITAVKTFHKDERGMEALQAVMTFAVAVLIMLGVTAFMGKFGTGAAANGGGTGIFSQIATKVTDLLGKSFGT